MALIINKITRPLLVRTNRHGKLYLRPLTGKDIRFLEGQVVEQLPAREFAARVIHHQLARPKLTEDVVRAWPDRLLGRVAALWWKEPWNGRAAFPGGAAPLEDFQQAVGAWLVERRKRDREMFERLMGPRLDAAEGLAAQLAREAQRSADIMRQALGGLRLPGPEELGLRDVAAGLVQASGLADYAATQAAVALAADAFRSIRPENFGLAQQLGLRDVAAELGRAAWATDFAAAQSAAAAWQPTARSVLDELRLANLVPPAESWQQSTQDAMRAALGSGWQQSAQDVLRVGLGFGWQDALGLAASDLVRDSLAAMWQGERDLVAQTLKALAPQRWLPDLPDLTRHWQEVARASQVLDAAGFGFTADLWAVASVIGLARLTGRTVAAVVTNIMLAATRSVAFEERLRAVFLGSPTLRRRWLIVEQALDAHRRGHFLVSIPALLPQVEGTAFDLLRVAGRAAAYKRDRIQLEKPGRPRLDRKGQHVKLKGLDALAKWMDFPGEAVLDALADLLAEKLAPDRNRILHGHRTSYGTARRSTQALLILLVLGRKVGEIEAGAAQQ